MAKDPPPHNGGEVVTGKQKAQIASTHHDTAAADLGD